MIEFSWKAWSLGFIRKPDIVENDCNLSIWEVESGASEIPKQVLAT